MAEYTAVRGPIRVDRIIRSRLRRDIFETIFLLYMLAHAGRHATSVFEVYNYIYIIFFL
jgi:hypothetical protein